MLTFIHPLQQPFITKAVEHFAKGYPWYFMHIPAGYGKLIIVAEVARQLSPFKVAVHTYNLIEATMWERQLKGKGVTLSVGCGWKETERFNIKFTESEMQARILNTMQPVMPLGMIVRATPYSKQL